MNNTGHKVLDDPTLEKELIFIWRKALDNDQLTIDDDFFESGGDSMLATQVLLEVEKLTGKSLPPPIMFETGTVRQLLQRITSTDEFKTRLSFLTGSADGKMIHFFHGDFREGGTLVNPFSKMLGADYLIHAISPHLAHEGKLPDSIEEMAKERVHKIMEQQPDGPYIILGYCHGALVGFEAARQLISMGKEVKAVVMLDPTIVSVRRSAQVIFITADLLMRLIGVDKNRRPDIMIMIWNRLLEIDKRTKDFWRRAFFFLKKAWPEKKSSFKKWFSVYSTIFRPKKLINALTTYIKIEEIATHYKKTLLSYRPLSLEVPVLYVAMEFSGRAWRRIAKDTVYMNIYRGNHSWFGEKYAPAVADEIRSFINR